MKAETAIVADTLTKYCGDFLAIDHVSFKVESGETSGFLGPYGAGKTAATRMLNGVSIPSVNSTLS